MAGKADCKKRKVLIETDGQQQSPSSSPNSLLMQAVINGKHNEVVTLLESSFNQLSAKTLSTAIYQTSANGHKRLLQIFIKHGVSINSKNGYTPLMAAAEHGYLDIVKLLVKNGVDVNSQTKDGRTALMLAAEKACSTSVIEFLISEKCHADVNVQDNKGRTALMISVQLCDISAMRAFIHHKEVNLSLQNKKKQTALDIARQNGICEEFCTLRDCAGDPFLNPLIVSVTKGDLRLLREFLDDDHYDIDLINVDGYTPLLLAIKDTAHNHSERSCRKDIILTLLKSGADVNKVINALSFAADSEFTPLMFATDLGDLEIVELLVKHGASVNIQTPEFKNYALLVASRNGYRDITEFLLKTGADFSLENSKGATALTSALIFGNISCADILIEHGAEPDDEDLTQAVYMEIDPKQYLLFSSVTKRIAVSSLCYKFLLRCFDMKDYVLFEFVLDHAADVERHLNSLLLTAVTKDVFMTELLLDRGANINVADKSGHTALMMAACSDMGDVVRLLVKRGANMNTDCDGKTALTHAITLQARSAVEALLQGGVDVNYVSPNSAGVTPLYLSISVGCNDIAAQLINHGANVNSANMSGETPLLSAIRWSNHVITSLLIRSGANLNQQMPCGSTMLHISLTNQESKIAEMLIKAGADYNIKDNKGRTPLMICSQGCASDVMLQLLKKGADVNATDDCGATALLYAVKHSILLTDKAETLLKHGADINKKDNNGVTAFMIAAKFCNKNVLKFLRDQGADPNTQDNTGSTVLFYTSNMSTETIEFLVSIGVDVNIQNNSGYTALMAAAERCDDLAMKALLSAGADFTMSGKGRNYNVFSVLLAEYNKCHKCFGENFSCKHYACMEMLVKAGARPDITSQCVLALYKAIICNKLQMVQLFVSCGVPPLEMPLDHNNLLNYSVPQNFFISTCGTSLKCSILHVIQLAMKGCGHVKSPLSAAMFCQNSSIIQYFIKNWYFNEKDMSGKSLYMLQGFLSGAKKIRLAKLDEEMLPQPWSLTVLSFVTVSACIGSHHDREKSIRALPIPVMLQEKLLFKNAASDLPVHDREAVNFVQPYQPLIGLNHLD